MDRHIKAVPDNPVPGPQGNGEQRTDVSTMSLVEAVDSGNYRDVLRVQQRQIAEALDAGAGAMTAQLHRTLTSLSTQLNDYDDLIGVQEKPRTPDEKFKGA